MYGMNEGLKYWRNQCGFTQDELAERIGVKKSKISKLENGQQELTLSYIKRISLALGIDPAKLLAESSYVEYAPVHQIPIIGDVQAGVWYEACEPDWETIEHMHLPVSDEFKQHAYGLVVRGDSMNKIYQEGSILAVVPKGIYGDPPSGKRVIVQRVKVDGIVEATAKELEIINGTARLWPRSTNPRWQEPIDIHYPNGVLETDNETVEITGVVIGAYKEE